MNKGYKTNRSISFVLFISSLFSTSFNLSSLSGLIFLSNQIIRKFLNEFICYKIYEKCVGNKALVV